MTQGSQSGTWGTSHIDSGLRKITNGTQEKVRESSEDSKGFREGLVGARNKRRPGGWACVYIIVHILLA